ncbi:MAG: hypothetical protein J5747_04685 [Spirochaetaceae bacterium]|nr:hypothetical protein [Spirochaetaceae bacterium]
MKAVIKQDFLRRRSGVLISSLVLFLLNITVIIAIFIARNGAASSTISQVITTEDGISITTTSGIRTFLEIAMPIIFMIDTVGVFVWALDQGAYNIGKDLKGDVGYLYKMVPRSGWNLLGGKLIVGTAEFLIYAIQSYIYMRLIGYVYESVISNTGTIFWTINGVSGNTNVNLFTDSLFLIFIAVVQFVLGSTLVSFASVTGTAFLKNRRFTKPIVAVGIFALAMFVGRITTKIINSMSGNFNIYNEGLVYELIWLGLLVELVFSAIFYVLTCILWEKKVSV